MLQTIKEVDEGILWEEAHIFKKAEMRYEAITYCLEWYDKYRDNEEVELAGEAEQDCGYLMLAENGKK